MEEKNMWFLIPIGLTIAGLVWCAVGFTKDVIRKGPARPNQNMDYLQENARQDLFGSKYDSRGPLDK